MSATANIIGQSVAAKTGYETRKTDKKDRVYGQTIGKPKLSDKAQKYYEELKKKYGDMDFVLVSSDSKGIAKAQAGNYGNPDRTVVLIDEEEVERMATDDNYRKKYEGIIDNAKSQILQLKDSLSKTGANVKSFGIQVNDNGTATLFAMLDKNLADKKENGEKKMFSANTVEELWQKVSDYSFVQRSDMVQTDAEKQVGQSFDFRIG